jgi:hypothetical protein
MVVIFNVILYVFLSSLKFEAYLICVLNQVICEKSLMKLTLRHWAFLFFPFFFFCVCVLVFISEAMLIIQFSQISMTKSNSFLNSNNAGKY